jgi:hypothetical protein
MTSSVTITDISAADAIAFKAELTHTGLVMEQDYTWRYQPVKYDNWQTIEIIKSQVTFEFRDPAVASFYRLKWTK